MPDGATLRGESIPSGLDWVLMLHDTGGDLDCWRPLAGPVAAAGFSVACLDLRGHGASDGEPGDEAALLDLPAILAQVRTDAPGGALVVVSAGKVGAALLDEPLAGRADGVVVFSPAFPGRPASRLRGEGMAKLFFVGAKDVEMDRTARELRNRSVGHAGVVSFPTSVQGTDLLAEPWISHVAEHVIGFARGVAPARPTTNSAGGRS